ncbi:hypothetical protein PanWU01x14_336280 [Parasponia andersonii]|uniref:Uncharacterized protein n=1 Tax=Parasponia andersonii TaxID=3476 RepID=A0A2P5AFZ3_PARAD|nr:hypothetical protein PanWU01x14_336280 [Parasponia andersonii]
MGCELARNGQNLGKCWRNGIAHKFLSLMYPRSQIFKLGYDGFLTRGETTMEVWL